MNTIYLKNKYIQQQHCIQLCPGLSSTKLMKRREILCHSIALHVLIDMPTAHLRYVILAQGKTNGHEELQHGQI